MSLRVLLVDDHRLFRDGLKRLLSTNDIEVVGESGNGQEAIPLVRERAPDLVLMDLEMPVLNGMEATRLIKAEHPDLPVVILTASEDEADLFEAVKSGASGYLLKSYAPETVVTLVRAAAEGEAALTPDLARKILDEFARIAGGGGQTGRPAPTYRDDDLKEPLSARERDVLEQLVTGASNREIADRLVVSENTVKYHLKNILQKLHLSNRAQVVAYALSHGIRPPAAG